MSALGMLGAFIVRLWPVKGQSAGSLAARLVSAGSVTFCSDAQRRGRSLAGKAGGEGVSFVRCPPFYNMGRAPKILFYKWGSTLPIRMAGAPTRRLMKRDPAPLSGKTGFDSPNTPSNGRTPLAARCCKPMIGSVTARKDGHLSFSEKKRRGGSGNVAPSGRHLPKVCPNPERWFESTPRLSIKPLKLERLMATGGRYEY